MSAAVRPIPTAAINSFYYFAELQLRPPPFRPNIGSKQGVGAYLHYLYR